jgi:hypothetical protein
MAHQTTIHWTNGEWNILKSYSDAKGIAPSRVVKGLLQYLNPETPMDQKLPETSKENLQTSKARGSDLEIEVPAAVRIRAMVKGCIGECRHEKEVMDQYIKENAKTPEDAKTLRAAILEEIRKKEAKS